MYYIVKGNGEKNFRLKFIEGANDGTYSRLKMFDFEVRGQFGRDDYANIWLDYENGLIDIKEVRNKLDAIKF